MLGNIRRVTRSKYLSFKLMFRQKACLRKALNFALSMCEKSEILPKDFGILIHFSGGGGGGGVQQQKRQRTSCDFPGGMIFFVLFCSLFEDILLTKSGKNNKKEH